MKITVTTKRSIIGLSVLVTLGVFVYFGVRYWDERQIEKARWGRIVYGFENCNLDFALSGMGQGSVMSSQSQERLIAADELAKFLLDESGFQGPEKLEDVWLDPLVEGSIGRKKPSDSSINLLAQCKKKIRDGFPGIWLEVGRYQLGIGNPIAVEWLNKAGEEGIADAYVLLGHAYRNGLITPIKDERAAFMQYMKAARMGSIKGQLYVAELLSSVDPVQARKYLVTAAQGGSLAATFILQDNSNMYSAVVGSPFTPATLKSAYFWGLIYSYLDGKSSGKNGKPSLSNLFEVLDSYGKSPNLKEAFQEYEFDGLPSKPWPYLNPDRKVIQRFNSEASRGYQEILEKRLDADSRIQVQEAARKWIEARQDQQKTEQQRPVEAKAPPNSTTLPSWKPTKLAACQANKLTKELNGTDLFKSFKPYIWAVTAKSKESVSGAFGTAVAVASNLLATNCHIVSGQTEITVNQDQVMHDARVLVADLTRDTCLLEVKAALPFAANSIPVAKLDVGTAAYALGNPQGMNLTFSNGIISGVRRNQGRDFIQTTTPISKGSSGGALIDDRGNLLGITTFYLQGGQAMNFAIPIEEFCK